MVGKGIPDRWRDYVPFGKVIKDTRIFALKVPLKPALSKLLPEEEIFTPQDVLLKLENLGLIVDLTNTARYYSGTEFVGRGVLYQKIKCEGHVVPSLEVVTKFFAIMDSFLNTEKEKLVGIHCTHGLNRTGYLVCRYLIQRLGFSPSDAIEEFNANRGHDMERQNYIEDLMSAKWKDIEIKTDFDLTKCEFLNAAPTEPEKSKLNRKRRSEERNHRDSNKRYHRSDLDTNWRHREGNGSCPHWNSRGHQRIPDDQYYNDQWYADSYGPSYRQGQWHGDGHASYSAGGYGPSYLQDQWHGDGHAPYSASSEWGNVHYNQEGGRYQRDSYHRSPGANYRHDASHRPGNSN